MVAILMPGTLTLWLKACKAVFGPALQKPDSTQALWYCAAEVSTQPASANLTDIVTKIRTKSVSDTGAGILRISSKGTRG